MQHRSFLIKPVSATCNFACTYCFYCDIAHNREQYSFGLMDTSVMKKLITSSLAQPSTHITYAFQGGEPTLAGLPFFEAFVATVEAMKSPQQTIAYALQTNGSLLNQEWATFFRKHNFLVGVSLDGFAKNHDQVRVDNNGNKTYTKVMEGIAFLKAAHVEYNILCVVTSSLSNYPELLYSFFKAQQFPYIQLIPCLPQLQNQPIDDCYALTPQNFTAFYNRLYELWLQDLLRGYNMSIALFDNIIPMFAGIPPQQCGMCGTCGVSLVVEANGNIYPCDFYTDDRHLLGNINDCSFDDIYQSDRLKAFRFAPRRYSKHCKSCEFYSLCGGNCKALSVAYFDDIDCGYYHFLKKNYQSMISLNY